MSHVPQFAFDTLCKALSQSGVAEERIAILRSHLRHENEYRILSDVLLQPRFTGFTNPDQALSEFFALVDASTLSLSDWIEGLEVFMKWLRERGRTTSFAHALGYLSCCAEFVQRQPSCWAMAPMVQTMLETYDFEGDDSPPASNASA